MHIPCLIVIAGPTAIGKTSVAIDVARHFHCDIVSADSRQFYRELPIGTAAPSASQLNQIRHHFIGNLSIHEPYDVSRYESEVLKLLKKLFTENQYAVLTGGSGLYVHAVTSGFDMLPASDQEIQHLLREKLNNEGISSLRAMLQQLDPEYYASVDLANPNRILRALEVCLSTGKPFSSFRKNQPAPRQFNTIKIGLELPREELHMQINARVDEMINSGLVEEARKLYPYKAFNALNTVGYKELFDYFEGSCSLEFAIEKIKTNTRRYARRQITWLRKDHHITWSAPNSNEVIELVEKRLNELKRK